ncbi:GNAT family N-acetyltransferase [Streptacidiphilus sp. EB129]|uniref:GNAT family N-acetyltransferase n=1 Tax=Streptacidiphilus sp. EB129 TaxID=3156262 RepID=UPI003515429F
MSARSRASGETGTAPGRCRPEPPAPPLGPVDPVIGARIPVPAPGTALPDSPRTGAHPVPERGPLVEVVRDAAVLDSLAAEWDALVDRCSAATPFQSHAWLSSWWHSYGRRGRLRVLTVRQDGQLVAVAPLMLRHRLLPLLTPIGVGLTDFLDILLDDAHAQEVAPLLASALARELHLNRPWAALDLRELRPGAAAHLLATHWPGARRLLPDSLCQHLPGAPAEKLLSRLSGRTAQRFRFKLRKLEATGIETRLVPAQEVPHAITELLALHELQWRGRGVTTEHLRSRFAVHLRRSATRMVAADRAAVRQYRLHGALVACELVLQGPDLVALYLFGAHPVLRSQVDIAGMLLRESLSHASETGRGEFSLLRGDEPYKYHWRPEQRRNERLLLGGGPAVALRAGAIRGRRGAVRVLRKRLPLLVGRGTSR